MITEFEDLCVICNRKATDEHHLLFGTANRRLADLDGLTIPLCREHHEAIHRNKELQVLSEIIGQLAYEKDQCSQGIKPDIARQSFMVRYGRSYL